MRRLLPADRLRSLLSVRYLISQDQAVPTGARLVTKDGDAFLYRSPTRCPGFLGGGQ